MSHLLPLSRVAKLVGQSRHSLQDMIRSGALATFDGLIELDELLRAFPDVKWDDDAEFRRVSEIKDKAFAKRVRERALPALVEMAGWKTLPQALPAFLVLGRMSSLAETEIQDKWSEGKRAEVLTIKK